MSVFKPMQRGLIDTNSFDFKSLSETDDFASVTSYSVQSLEDILNEPDPQIFDETFFEEVADELSKRHDYFDDVSEITSIGASSSFSRELSQNLDWKRPQRKKPKSQILRCIKLRRVSSQLASADDKIKSGTPTSIAVGCTHIAVGTAHGLTLIFDAKQVMTNCLGNSKNSLDQGFVSSLCFNRDDSKLVSGFAKGSLLLHDAKSGRLLARCDVIQALNNGILSCQFLSPASNSLCLVNDAGGSVYAINFGRSAEKSCRCLFTGSKGDVCKIAALSAGPLGQFRLVALTSLTKLIVLTLRPSLRVRFTIPQEKLEADAKHISESPPLIAWSPQAYCSVHESLLAYGRLNCVQIFRLGMDKSLRDELNVATIRRIDVFERMHDILLINLIWINSKCLLVLDQSETAKVYDVSNGECLESVDLSDLQLVYSTALFKGLSTGGNVSKALAFMADNVCYNSVSSCGYGFGTGQIVLLGHKSVFALSLNSWLDCVNSLASAEPPDYTGAISLCLDYFTGKRRTDFYGSGSAKEPEPSSANQIERSLDWKRRKMSIIQEKALSLLLEFVDVSMTKLAPDSGKIQLLLDHYRNVVPFCLETCVALHREDIIYGLLYDRFSVDSLANTVFFDCLDEYIIDNKLSNLPPALVQEFFAHLEHEGFYSAIENCVTHLPIPSLDLHQVMTVCRNYNLYDAIIYIFKHGLQDYMSPLQEMTSILRNNIEEGECLSDEDIRLGNKLLLYITCCLSGKSYFSGDLTAEVALKVITETYDFLTDRISSSADQSFDNVKTLLKFDCREFLNGLGMAFEGEFFRTRNGSVKMRYLVDVLLKVVLTSCDWSPFQTGALFTFITRNVVMHSGELLINNDQFHQILELVICGDIESVGTSVFEEKQQALLDLLQKPQARDLIDEAQLISLSEKHHYYQVCEMIYSRRREYEKVVICYANDPYRRDSIFTYVHDVLLNKDILLSEKLAVKSKFLRLLQTVAPCDTKECAHLLANHFTSSFLTVCSELGEESELLCEVMKEIYEIRVAQNDSVDIFCSDRIEDAELTTIFVNLLCVHCSASDLLNLLKRDNRFITKRTLDICQKHRLISPILYLFIAQNRIDDALSLLSEELDAVSSNNDCAAVDDYLRIFEISLADKYSKTENSAEVEWLKLLDVVLCAADKMLERNKTTISDFKAIVINLISNAISVLDSSLVLKRMLEHSTFKAMNYGEIGPMIDAILRGYKYEQVLLDALIRCLKGESRNLLKKLIKTCPTAIAIRDPYCDMCGRKLGTLDHEKNEKYIAFKCSHTYELSCLQAENSYRLDKHGVREYNCLRCFDSIDKKGSKLVKKLPQEPALDHAGSAPNHINPTDFDDSKPLMINPLYGTKSKIALLDDLRKTSVFRFENGKLIRDIVNEPVDRSRDDDLNFKLAPPHV